MSTDPRKTSCLLDQPSECYRESFLKGATEFFDERRLNSTYAESLGYDLRKLEKHFSAFVADLRQLGQQSNNLISRNQDCVFWLIDHGEYVGQLSVRPNLDTPYLITYGGHIGYGIRPSLRRRGYGQIILSLALEKCRDMGLNRILITCDSDNLASKKIIERNGGEFESAMNMDDQVLKAEGRQYEKTIQKLRYWIDLKSTHR